MLFTANSQISGNLAEHFLPAFGEEKCGVVAVRRKKGSAASTAAAITRFQHHRGQGGVGLVSIDKQGQVYRFRQLGHPLKVLPQDLNIARSMHGSVAIGHNRYPTAHYSDQLAQTPREKRARDKRNLQPLELETRFGRIFVSHNGNLVNYAAWKKILQNDYGIKFRTDSDTELVLHLINLAPVRPESTDPLKDALKFTLGVLPGTYSLIIMARDKEDRSAEACRLFAACDGSGNRPLCVARAENEIIVASEDYPVFSLSQERVKSLETIEAGELVEITSDFRIRKERFTNPELRHCAFELFYQAHIKSNPWGIAVMDLRRDFGSVTAMQMKKSGLNFSGYKFAIPLPESAYAAVSGFSETALLTTLDLFEKVDAKERNFIAKCANDWRTHSASFDDALMEHGFTPDKKFKIRERFIRRNDDGTIVLKDFVVDMLKSGPGIFLMDDSVVRANTMKAVSKFFGFIDQRLKKEPDYKPIKLHIVSAAPQIEYLCNKGVAIYSLDELLSYRHNSDLRKMAEEIASVLADTKIEIQISFLSLDKFRDAMGDKKDEICYSCMEAGGNPARDPLHPDHFRDTPLPGKIVPALRSRKIRSKD